MNNIIYQKIILLSYYYLMKTKKQRYNKDKKTKKYSMKSVKKKKEKIALRICNRLNKTIKQNIITIGIVTAPYIVGKQTYITSYMASSYKKWLESAGALIVPIQFDLPSEVIHGLLKQINGICLIGGGIVNKKTHDHNQFIKYKNTMETIFNYVIYSNKNNNYYPMWCTCMSFELIILYIKNLKFNSQSEITDNYLSKSGKYGESKLHWTNEPSKIKKMFTKSEIKCMSKYPCLFQAHQYSHNINSKIIKTFKDIANIPAVGIASDNSKYINIFELKDYPIYGVQFHPEKPPFEYENSGKRVPKTQIAITLSFKLAKFFIKECKKNHNIWIGGKNYYDFTINDYNLFNKNISRRLTRLTNSTLTTNQIGDAGIYLFGKEIFNKDTNIISNPWSPINKL